jgi:O-antigen/teichoic acid export membrane protein
MNEVKHSLIRIFSNYIRSGATFVMGLLLVPLLLNFGKEAYGLIMLLVSLTGSGLWIENIIRHTMIRELGVVYHNGDLKSFRCTYCTALLFSIGLGLLFIISMLILAWSLPHVFRIPDELHRAGCWFIIISSLRTFLYIVLAPTFNMYLVAERMSVFNFWMAAMRGSFPLAAWVVLLRGVESQNEAIVQYAIWSSLFGVMALCIAIGWLMWKEPNLRLFPFQVSKDAAWGLCAAGGWNTAANIAMATQLTIGTVIMNLIFGVVGNMLFSIAVQLCGYMRMATGGMTYGLDAVTARMSANGVDDQVRKIFSSATLLHSWVAFPATAAILILAEPIIQLWVAARIDDAAMHIPKIAVLSRIVVLGLMGLALADGWIKILYGAGQVRRYAPHLVAAAILNPVLAWIFLLILPEAWQYQAVAWAYTIINVSVMLIKIPYSMSVWLKISEYELARLFVKPLIATLCSLPVLLITVNLIDKWSLITLIATGIVYLGVYITASVFIILDGQKGQNLIGDMRKRLKIAMQPTFKG